MLPRRPILALALALLASTTPAFANSFDLQRDLPPLLQRRHLPQPHFR